MQYFLISLASKESKDDSDETSDPAIDLSEKKVTKSKEKKRSSTDKPANKSIFLISFYEIHKIIEKKESSKIDTEIKTSFTKSNEVLHPYKFNGGVPVKLPIQYISEPPPNWRVRPSNPEHVKELVASIEKNYAQSEIEPGGVVIFDNVLSIKNQKKLLKYEDLLNYLEEDNTCFCYSGEHRRRALITLKEVNFFNFFSL
jgi:hypothetical protein